jgi:hypothetical protein
VAGLTEGWQGARGRAEVGGEGRRGGALEGYGKGWGVALGQQGSAQLEHTVGLLCLLLWGGL